MDVDSAGAGTATHSAGGGGGGALSGAGGGAAGAGDAGAGAGEGSSTGRGAAVLENEFVDLSSQLLDSKIAAAEQEQQQVADGTHDQFVRECAKQQAAHDAKLRLAAEWRKVQLENIERMYECEVQEADTALRSYEESLRARLMSLVSEKLRVLHEEKALTLGHELGAQTRKLRRRGGNEPPPVVADAVKEGPPIGVPIDYTLAERDILADLYLIRSDTGTA